MRPNRSQTRMLAKMISSFSLWISGEASKPGNAFNLRKTHIALRKGAAPERDGGSCLCVFEDLFIAGKCKKICFLNTSVFIKNILRFVIQESAVYQVVPNLLVYFYAPYLIEQSKQNGSVFVLFVVLEQPQH